MLIEGRWAKDFDPVQAKDEDGGFVRQASEFRNWVTRDGAAGPSGTGGFAAEAGRYHLYVALICPWACRTLMARKLKGLESVIDVTVVNPRLGPRVWSFGGFPGAEPDPLYASEHVYELYLRADPQYTGQITVPILWDKQRETIVNNESSEIIRMFNDGFADLAENDIDLYPQALQCEIDIVNEALYHRFNNGVYRAGFATTQSAYSAAYADVGASLEFLESRLEQHDYLVGDRLTEADIRAFVTLVRFDPAYYGLFKTNHSLIAQRPRLKAYAQRIYQLPGLAETVNLDHIKAGYYSIEALNPLGLVPAGPDMAWLQDPPE